MDRAGPPKTSSDGLHTKVQNFVDAASPNSFEQTLHTIGYQLHLLGDAVVVLAEHNRKLLDTSLGNCREVLQESCREVLQEVRSVTNTDESQDPLTNMTAHAGKARTEYAYDQIGSSPPAKNSKNSRAVCSLRESGDAVEEGIEVNPTWQGPRESKKSRRTKKASSRAAALEYIGAVEKETPLNGARRKVAIALQNRKAEYAVGSLIVANAAVLGYQSDIAVQDFDKESPKAFRVCDVFFTIAFTLELALRLFADGNRFFSYLNRDRNWNVFDSIMVVSAIGDELVGAIVGSSTANMSAVRVLRILRLVRVIRVIRVMRIFSDLRLMVAGIINCLKPLTWAICLLCLIMFCFAVCILQFCASEMKQSDEDGARIQATLNERYGSLLKAMVTLYMSITGGIDWIEATEPLMFSPMLVIIYGCYIAFALFCVLNIITGVFVENAHKMSGRDEDHMIMEEMEKQQHWLKDVKRAFTAADKDGNGEVNIEEFKAFQQDPRMQAFLQKLGVDWSLEDAERLFKQIDFDQTGTIALDEFIMAIQKLTGAARAMDMINLMNDTKVMKKSVAQLVDQNEKELKRMRTGSIGSSSHTGAKSTQSGVVQVARDNKNERFAESPPSSGEERKIAPEPESTGHHSKFEHGGQRNNNRDAGECNNGIGAISMPGSLLS